MPLRTALLRVALAAMLCACASGSSSAPSPSVRPEGLATWDQERVTAIANEFAEATNVVYGTFYNQPTPTAGSGQWKSYYRLKQTVRRLKLEARHLSAALQDGKAYDETLPIFERLMELVRDAREEARRTFLTDELLNKVAVANDALRRLSPYYDPKALSET